MEDVPAVAPDGSYVFCPGVGVTLIAGERLRQVGVEGWTPDHDDQYNTNNELAKAARAYLTPEETSWWKDPAMIAAATGFPFANVVPPDCWPAGWSWSWWRPGTNIQNLTKAGALIAAEIDRLTRLEEKND